MSTNFVHWWDYSCVRELSGLKILCVTETFRPWPPQAAQAEREHPLFCFVCMPLLDLGGIKVRNIPTITDSTKVTGVIFKIMTTAKINTAPETCCFTPWIFALIHCLRIFQGDPSLLIFPSGGQQAGPESHVHCCHHGLGLWPGTKWLCLAGASPWPRAVHDVMNTVVSSRVLYPVDQTLINSPIFSSIPPSTIS